MHRSDNCGGIINSTRHENIFMIAFKKYLKFEICEECEHVPRNSKLEWNSLIRALHDSDGKKASESLRAIFMIAGAEMGPLCMTLLFSSSPFFFPLSRYHYFYLIQITISRAQRRLATEAHYPQKKRRN